MAIFWNRIRGLDRDPANGPFGKTGVRVHNMADSDQPAASSSNNGLLVYDTTNNQLEAVINGSWTAIGTPTAGNNTLDNAYDQGGPGAGNTITVDTTDVIFNLSTGTNFLVNAASIGTTAAGIEVSDNGGTFTDALLFSSTNSIVDAIDASAATITNAINIGANNILGTNFNVIGSTGSVACESLDRNSAGQLIIGGTVATSISLAQDTTVSGTLTSADNLSVTNGSLTVIDTADETVFSLTADSATANHAVEISANGLTSGYCVNLITSAAGLTTGGYLRCFDGASENFTIGPDGRTTITSNSSTSSSALSVNSSANITGAQVSIANSGTPGSNATLLRIDGSSLTATNNPALVSIDGGTSAVTGLRIVTGSTLGSTTAHISMTSSVGGTEGVLMNSFHNKAAGATNDNVLVWNMLGNDSGGSNHTFGRMRCVINDATAGTEIGGIAFDVTRNGVDGAQSGMFTAFAGPATGLILGDGSSEGVLSSAGAFDLLLHTNGGTNSGTIRITDGINGNISIAPNGDGSTIVDNAAIRCATRTIPAGTASDSPTNSDSVIVVNTDAVTALTITLPEAANNLGLILTFIFDTDGGQNVTINRTGTDVIDEDADLGNTSITMDDAGDFIQICAVTNDRWIVIKKAGVILV